jgi:hypothetical protein
MTMITPLEGLFAREEFTLGSWTYLTSDEHSDGDARKLSHWAVNGETGETKSIPLSPYQTLTEAHFTTLIALGFPSQAEVGTFDLRTIDRWANSIDAVSALREAGADGPGGTGRGADPAPGPHYRQIADAEYALRRKRERDDYHADCGLPPPWWLGAGFAVALAILAGITVTAAQVALHF